MDTVFYRFINQLEKQGVITYSGSIVDATFVDAPRQRNSREENKEIKEGKTPEKWKENPHKLSQKDTDARWMTKNKERHYGYKNHVKIDKKTKLITKATTTSAEVHDSKELKNLVDKKDRVLYGDGAYTGEEVQKCIPANVKNRIHEKGYRNRPLTQKQKDSNKRKLKVRARIEHVFGFMTNSMSGLYIRTIGKVRAHVQITLINIVYNLQRYAYLMEARAI